MTFADLAGRASETGGPIVGSANMDPAGAGSAFATHVVDVEVDPETGKIEILRYTAAQDSGTSIHPSYVEGQIQGGVVQGIGWALNEEYYMSDDGQMMNTSLLDYRMPTSLGPADDRHGSGRGSRTPTTPTACVASARCPSSRR